MVDFAASVDAGNGVVNAVMMDTNGKLHRFSEPSVRAPVSGQSLGLKGQEMEYTWVDWGANRYATGDEALAVAVRGIERHIGINRYGNEFHQFLVATALAKMGVAEGSVDLTLFAPPGLYLDVKPVIVKNFTRKHGKVAIKLKGDSQPRVFEYGNVTILPEGIGAAACFVLDEDGNPVETDALNGNVLILDSGAYTLDSTLLRNGSFNPETLQHASWEKSGVHHFVREPVLAAVRALSSDFELLTVEHIDAVIRQGVQTGDFTLDGADLKGAIQKHSERYAEWIANSVIDAAFDGLRGIRSLILIGGGALLVEKHLKKWYGDKVLDRKAYPHVKKVAVTDMNAVGGLRRALYRLRQKQAI